MKNFLALLCVIIMTVIAATNVRAAIDKPGQADRSLRRETLRTFDSPGRYVQQIEDLRKYAKAPGKKDLDNAAPYLFCDCSLNGVLEESQNRTTYFFKPRSPHNISDAMMTISQYKRDGGSIDTSGARFDVEINQAEGSFTLAKSASSVDSVISVVWFHAPDSPDATSVELS